MKKVKIELSYETYPMVLYTSFSKEDTPPELPFEVLGEEIKQQLGNTQTFDKMFSYIAINNSLKGNNGNVLHYIDDCLFDKLDNINELRQKYFHLFLSERVQPKYGVLLFCNYGQYVYIYLDPQDTQTFFGKSGRYLAVAMFSRNFFIGFEEGFVSSEGIQLENTGIYGCGMDKGGFLSFVMVALAYAEDKNCSVLSTSMKETIYKLE